MSKISIEMPEITPVPEISKEDIEEIREDISEEIIESNLEVKEEIAEIIPEIVEEKGENIKEELQTWLKELITPITETLVSLSAGLLSVSQKVAELSTPQVLPEPMNSSEMSTETLFTESVESPTESEDGNLEAVAELVDQPAQSLLREIHKL